MWVWPNGRVYDPAAGIPDAPAVPRGFDPSMWSAFCARLQLLARSVAVDPAADLPRRTAWREFQVAEPEFADLLQLAHAPIQVDPEPVEPDDGLPAGWPPGWPRVGAPAPVDIDAPGVQRPGETPAEVTRRVAERRAEPRALTAAASQREEGEKALAELLRITGRPRGRSPVRPRSLVASAHYAGGLGRFRVRLEDGHALVMTADGRWLPGMTIDERCMPVPIRADAPTQPAAVVAAAHDDTTERRIGRLAAAVERLATRPQPPIQVDVHVPVQPAPVVNVTVQQPPARAVRVEVDDDGTKRFIPEDV